MGNFLNDSLREGFVTPVLLLAAIIAVGALAASPIVPVADLLRSLRRLPTAGSLDVSETIPPKAKDQIVDLDIRPAELKSLEIKSDQDLTLRLVEYGIINQAKESKISLVHNEPYKWMKSIRAIRKSAPRARAMRSPPKTICSMAINPYWR